MSGLKIGVLVAVCAALCSAIVLPAARPAPQAPASLANDPKLIEDLVYANRILYQQEVLDGFGHVSVRSDKDPRPFSDVAQHGAGARHVERHHGV